MSTGFDFIEFLAVFLLSVEAIKLENFRRLNELYVKPLGAMINPKITFVEEVVDLGFVARNAFNLIIVVFYVVGLCACWMLLDYFGIDAFGTLVDAGPGYWVLALTGSLFVFPILGFLPYQLMVWCLEGVIRCLTWIQMNTASGVVGGIGFLLFALQFLGRRFWAAWVIHH